MNTSLGLLGILGIWLTMAAMPLTEYLGLTAYQATLLRGMSGVVILGLVAVCKRGFITLPDQRTVKIVLYFVMATLCLFGAVGAWGTNFTALFLDLAVLVPLWFAWRRGQKLGSGVTWALIMALFGTALTLQVYQVGVFRWEGFLFSLGAMVANGLFIQYAGKATQSNWNKAFWMSAGLVLVGLLALTSSAPVIDVQEWKFILLLLVFSMATGLLNFYFAFMAFSNLSAISVGILVLGVTPSIIISSYCMLDRGMGFDQLFGVGLTLVAVLIFGLTLQKK